MDKPGLSFLDDCDAEDNNLSFIAKLTANQKTLDEDEGDDDMFGEFNIGDLDSDIQAPANSTKPAEPACSKGLRSSGAAAPAELYGEFNADDLDSDPALGASMKPSEPSCSTGPLVAKRTELPKEIVRVDRLNADGPGLEASKNPNKPGCSTGLTDSAAGEPADLPEEFTVNDRLNKVPLPGASMESAKPGGSTGLPDHGGEPAKAEPGSAPPPVEASTAGQHMLPATEPDSVPPEPSRRSDLSSSADEDARLAGTDTDQPAAEAAARALESPAPASQQAPICDAEMLHGAEPAGMEECEPPVPPTELLDDMQLEEAFQEPHLAPCDANSTLAAASSQAHCNVPAGDEEVTEDHMDVVSDPAAPSETATAAAACEDQAPDAGKEVALAEQMYQQSVVAVEEHTEQLLDKQSAGDQQSAPAAHGHAEHLRDKQSAGDQQSAAAAQGHAGHLRDKQSTGNQQSAAIDPQSASNPSLAGRLTLKPLQHCMASCGEAASPVVPSQLAFGSPLSEEQPGSAGLSLNPQPLTPDATAVVPGAATASVRGGLGMLFMPLPATKLAASASMGKQPMAGSSRPAGGWFDGSAAKVSASPAARRATSGPYSRPLAQAPNGMPGPHNVSALRATCASPIATPAQLGSGASLSTAMSPLEACGAATPDGMQLPPRIAVTQHAATQSRLARSTKASSLLQNSQTAACSLPESASPVTAAPHAQQPVASPDPGADAVQQLSHTPAPVSNPAAATAAAWLPSRAGSGKDAEQSVGLEPGAAGAGSATQCGPAAAAPAPVDTSRAKDMVVYSKRLEDMLLSLQMLNDEALELRVAVAIAANRVARLDNPMLSKALDDMAAEARVVHCEE